MNDQRPDQPIDRCNDTAWICVTRPSTRLTSAISVVAVMVLQLLLPDRLTIGSRWFVPAVEAAVLVALLIVSPNKLDAEARNVRVIALGLVAVLIAANGSTLGLLIHHLLRTGDSIVGRTLIYSAAAVWANNVVAFGILYWEIDRGGPVKRCTPDHSEPDFLFPQMTSPTSTVKRWTPRLLRLPLPLADELDGLQPHRRASTHPPCQGIDGGAGVSSRLSARSRSSPRGAVNILK